MSSQSASTRTAPQATVNAYSESTPVELTEDHGSRSEADTRVSVWWIPALMIGAWVELAYVVPAVAHWFAQLN